MVEPRREQAAEEGGPECEGWQALPDGVFDCHSCVSSFPLRGNGLCKPLDSGLRRNDGEGRGVARIQNQGCLLCHLPGDRWRQFLIVQQHQLEPNIPISGGNPVHIAGPDEQVAPGGIGFLLILPDCVTIAP